PKGPAPRHVPTPRTPPPPPPSLVPAPAPPPPPASHQHQYPNPPPPLAAACMRAPRERSPTLNLATNSTASKRAVPGPFSQQSPAQDLGLTPISTGNPQRSGFPLF